MLEGDEPLSPDLLGEEQHVADPIDDVEKMKQVGYDITVAIRDLSSQIRRDRGLCV